MKNNREEKESLLNNKTSELKEIKEGYMDLINSINIEENLSKCAFLAKNLQKKLIEKAKEDLKYNKIGGWLSGIIPFFDILIQHYIKENAKKKIEKRFDDNLEDLDKKDSNLTKKEKNNIDDVKEEINDVPSDILKSIGRVATISINIASKISFFALAGIGIGIGTIVGGTVTENDINALLDFYGKRFVYRCLVSLSFKKIQKYLLENFIYKEK